MPESDGTGDKSADVRLRSVTVPAHSHAIGRTLGDLALDQIGASITAIRRRGIRGVDPAPDARLLAGDGVVLRGSSEALARAEELLSARRTPRVR